jgi:hypothetical protein
MTKHLRRRFFPGQKVIVTRELQRRAQALHERERRRPTLPPITPRTPSASPAKASAMLAPDQRRGLGDLLALAIAA